jgi:16S rRNA (cytosine967-C5)-methyltransferase
MRVLYRPLWEGMQRSLHDIFVSGYAADKVIQHQLKANRKWGSHDRRLFAEGVYELTRWWRRLLWVCDVAWPEGDRWTLDDPEVFARATEAWCLIQGQDAGEPVELDRTIPRCGLKREDVLARWQNPSLPRAVRESIPNALDAWGASELGTRWDEVLPILNSSAPVFLRANTLRTSAAKLVQALGRERLEAEAIAADAIRLKRRGNVFLTEAFKRGLFEVQDWSSQQVAPELQLEPGLRLIDACAGAGGKTLHAAALMRNKGKIIALDVSEKKLNNLRERATRAGATSIEVRHIEGTKTIKRLVDSADRLLLDVPCTGVGVWRRNPDSRWQLTREEIERLRTLQGEILSGYSAMCKSGGVMVYATCSIMPSENRAQVDRFLSQTGTAWRLEEERTLWPERDAADGFYWARLRRS